MLRNICGNCANFKPGKGQRFFNCTYAKHAGTSYGMQVRADTESCDAFKPIQTQTAPAPSKQTRPKTAQVGAGPPGLCPWGRLIVILAIVVILVLLAWAAYACALKGTTHTGTPTPPITTGEATPAPTLAPKYLIIGNYTVGQWAQIPGELASVVSASKVSCIEQEIGCKPAPAGLVYIAITVAASNTGQNQVPFDTGEFLLGDATGLRWQVSDYGGGIGPSGDIAPGQSAQGSLWFSVPDVPFSGLRLYWALMGNPMTWAAWNLPF